MSEPNRAYPNEIAAVVRQQTFFIDSYLSPAASNDGYENAPLMMYGHFSRYRMFIINKDRKRAFANVPVQQMRGMIDLTKAIYPEYIKEKLLGADKPQGNEPEHPCYKVTFSSGNLKGMTPAQILVRDGDKGVEALRGQYKFLRDNLNKYPRNKAVMDAITDAVDLFKSGKLNADSASSGAGKHVTLYDVSLRPLVRQKRNDGMCFVYNCKITWDFTAAAPITIVIENYYAPVEKIEGGRLNVKASQRGALKQSTLSPHGMIHRLRLRARRTMRRVWRDQTHPHHTMTDSRSLQCLMVNITNIRIRAATRSVSRWRSGDEDAHT